MELENFKRHDSCVQLVFHFFLVEWPQNGNLGYGLIESPPVFGITWKGEFKIKMRNSQNPGAEFLLTWPEKRKACEIPYKFQLHWPLILTYMREKTLLLNFGVQSKLGQIDKIKTYTCILFHKATNQKLRTCSKKNPNSSPGHGTIQDLSLAAWTALHWPRVLQTPWLSSCSSKIPLSGLLPASRMGAAFSCLGLGSNITSLVEKLLGPQPSKGPYFCFS